MIMDEINDLMKFVEQATTKLGASLTTEDYMIEDMGCPHKTPKELPQGYGAIYIFVYGTEESHEYLKIGMVHRNSNARYTTQHYGFNANSTLAKSICEDDEFIKLKVTTDNVKDWMHENLRRINILIKDTSDKKLLELVEAIFHYRLKPRYEGHTSTYITENQ